MVVTTPIQERLCPRRWAAPAKLLVALWLTSACGAAPKDPGTSAVAGTSSGGATGDPDASEAPGGGGGATGGSVNSGAAGEGSLPGSGGGSSNGGSAGSGVSVTPVYTPTPSDTELATASGCAGVFNPNQLLTLAFAIDPEDRSGTGSRS